MQGFPRDEHIRAWIREVVPGYESWAVQEGYDFARFLAKRFLQQLFLQAANEAPDRAKITPQHMLRALQRHGA